MTCEKFVKPVGSTMQDMKCVWRFIHIFVATSRDRFLISRFKLFHARSGKMAKLNVFSHKKIYLITML